MDKANSIQIGDPYSLNTCIYDNSKLIGAGRMLINPPSHLGFRISTSLNLDKYFQPSSVISEFSGVAISKEYRKKGLYYQTLLMRFLLAKHFKVEYIFAIASENITKIFEKVGYSVVEENFIYKHMKALRNFLIMDISNKRKNEALEELILNKVENEAAIAINSFVHNEIEKGLNIFPIKN